MTAKEIPESMREFMNKTATALFGTTLEAAIKGQFCLSCKTPFSEVKESKMEMSGLCFLCQLLADGADTLPQQIPNGVKVKLAKLSVCSCGYSFLKEEICIGTEYTIWPRATRVLQYKCGGCNMITQKLNGVLASHYKEPLRAPNYLPVELFSWEN